METSTLRASFGFGIPFVETKVPREGARPIVVSKRPLRTSCWHFDLINQLRQFPSSSDFSLAYPFLSIYLALTRPKKESQYHKSAMLVSRYPTYIASVLQLTTTSMLTKHAVHTLYCRLGPCVAVCTWFNNAGPPNSSKTHHLTTHSCTELCTLEEAQLSRQCPQFPQDPPNTYCTVEMALTR